MILITGACGYIGSHLIELLEKNNIEYIGYDNLSSPFYFKPVDNLVIGSINDKDMIKSIFDNFDIDVVIHLAGLTDIKDSVYCPAKYVNTNINGFNNVLDHARRVHNIQIIYISSFAIYSDTYDKITEKHQKYPRNIYAITNYVSETILNRYAYSYNLRYTILRISNVGGGIVSRNDLISRCFKQDELMVNGIEHPTEDGSPVRDFVDVRDAADAIYKCINNNSTNYEEYNICSGVPTSVLEAISAINKYKPIKIKNSLKMAFDPSYSVGNYTKFNKITGWKPQYEFRDIIEYSNKFYKEYLKVRN